MYAYKVKKRKFSVVVRLFLALLVLPCTVFGGGEGVHVESLFAQARGMERRFQHQGLFFEDRMLEEYLGEILVKLALPEERQFYNLRVRILKSRVVNAFAAPDGTVYVTTGLLARLVNETQIAAVMVHELGHIVKNHTARSLLAEKERALMPASEPVRGRRRGRDAQPQIVERDAYARIFSSGIGIAGDAFQMYAHDYALDFEREADSLGLARLAAGGYMNDDADDNIARVHFKARFWNVILYEAGFALAAGDFELADMLIERLLAIGVCNAAALTMRGDMERFLAPRSTASVRWYEDALRCDPGNRGALLSMGFAHHSIGRPDACEYLGKYSEIAEDGVAIKMVRELLLGCEL
ncbi:MAG: M48 family metalloprotease [Chitinispirillales bacterium]|jgi:hypothetical protein|nr:M48 family metalloprotease [Chitinispirillales bacterium]